MNTDKDQTSAAETGFQSVASVKSVVQESPSYKGALTDAMTQLARDPARRFIGYGLAGGKGALGTLRGVPAAQIVEMPVAEGLMVSAAIGMACAGLKPVVYFERMDFMLNAADAIVNHLDKLATISRGEFRPGIILRATVGNRTKHLFTGPTHTQDLSDAFDAMLGRTLVRTLCEPHEIAQRYTEAAYDADRGESTLLVEYKDLF